MPWVRLSVDHRPNAPCAWHADSHSRGRLLAALGDRGRRQEEVGASPGAHHGRSKPHAESTQSRRRHACAQMNQGVRLPGGGRGRARGQRDRRRRQQRLHRDWRLVGGRAARLDHTEEAARDAACQRRRRPVAAAGDGGLGAGSRADARAERGRERAAALVDARAAAVTMTDAQEP